MKIGFLRSFLTYIYTILMAVVRDYRGAVFLGSIKVLFARFQRENSTIFAELERNARKHPNKECIVFDDQIWTFKDVWESIFFSYIIITSFDFI